MAGRSCPSCGASISDDSSKCPNCRHTLFRATAPQGLPTIPDIKPREIKKVPLHLPRYVPDARYCFGTTWTSGCLWLVAEGIFFLSEKDGFNRPEACAGLAPTPGVSKVGTLGFFAPEKDIEKINRKVQVNAFAMITGRKVPLRLNGDGWVCLDTYCALAGIPSE